jgi:hypothetical protein
MLLDRPETTSGSRGFSQPGREFVTFRFGNRPKQCAPTGASIGGIAMRLLRSRARVQVDDDTQLEGQVERAVEIFSRVEDEIRDFVGRDVAASRHRLEECSDLTPANVASLLQRLPATQCRRSISSSPNCRRCASGCNTKRRWSSARSCNTQ